MTEGILEADSAGWETAIVEWLRGRGLSGGGLSDVRPIGGGTQNVLIRFTFGRDELVYRQPPSTNGRATVFREERTFACLAGSDVPHPQLVGAEADPVVTGAPFLVQRYVPGFNVLHDPPQWILGNSHAQAALADAAARAVATVAKTDVTELARDQRDRRSEWVPWQVRRWTKLFHEYEAVAGYPQRALLAASAVKRKLEHNQPRELRFGLVHGDLHLGNILFGPAGVAVSAIVDWELAAIGDTRLDLAHLVVTWPGTLESWPAPEQWTCVDTARVVERYIADTRRTVDDFAWFRTLAAYRMAALLEGTFVRSLRQLADTETGRRLHSVAVELLEIASQN